MTPASFTDIKPKGLLYKYLPNSAYGLDDPTKHLPFGELHFSASSEDWCSYLDSIQVREHALTDRFSPVAGKKMLISAWVKESGTDCKCSTYVNNHIGISFTTEPAESTLSQVITLPVFKPSGNMVEGWQRYEGEFTVPADAKDMTVGLTNSSTNGTTTSVDVYFDDIRIHPFSANMKSFVYDPVNLRLTSELDENNYASFYEYDNDGTLTRVKKETEKGIKTITETRSALQQAVK